MRIDENRVVRGIAIPVYAQKAMISTGLCAEFDPYEFAELKINMDQDGGIVYLSIPYKAQILWAKIAKPNSRIITEGGMENNGRHWAKVLYYENKTDTDPTAVGVGEVLPSDVNSGEYNPLSSATTYAMHNCLAAAGFDILPTRMSLAEFVLANPGAVPAEDMPASFFPVPPATEKAPESLTPANDKPAVKKTKGKKKDAEPIIPEVDAPAIEEIMAVTANDTPTEKTEEIPVYSVPARTTEAAVQSAVKAAVKTAAQPIMETTENKASEKSAEAKVKNSEETEKKPHELGKALDNALNGYAAFDRDFSETDIPDLVNVVIQEGGTNLKAGQLVLTNKPFCQWVVKFADNEACPMERRVQARIIRYLLDYAKQAGGEEKLRSAVA